MANLKPAVLLLFFAAFFTRFFYFTPGIFHADGADFALATERFVNTGEFRGAHSPGYPGEVLLVSFFFFFHKLLGATNAEASINLVTALCGALSIVVFYYLCKEMFSSLDSKEELALIAGALFLFSPIAWSISEHPLSDTPANLFLLLSALCIYKKTPYISALLFGFSVLIRLTNVVFLPAYLLMFNYNFPTLASNFKLDKKNAMKLVSALVVLGVTAGSLYAYDVAKYGARESSEYAQQINLSNLVELLPRAANDVAITMSVIGIVAVIVGIVNMKNNKELALILISWIFVFFVFVAAVSAYEARFLLPIIAPLSILAALGIKPTMQINRYAPYAVLAVVLVLMLSTIFPLIERRHEHCYSKEFVIWLGERVPDNSVLLAEDFSLVYKFYDRERNIEIFGIGRESDLEKIDERLKNGKRVFLIFDGVAYASKPLIDKLAEEYDQVLVGNHTYEDFHHATISDRQYVEYLFEIKLKPESSE